MKAVLIAGTSSGVGKTCVSLGLMAALRQRGISVQPFKVGPDFIDPLFHQTVCCRASRNLDGWLMEKEAVLSSFRRASRDADFGVIEGVMGLYDGYDARSDAGSTGQIAKWLDVPVILVVDARSMARSAAALVKGFETFDPAVKIVGVIFNRVAGKRHLQWLTEAVEGHCGARCLGGVLREEELIIPERHLGLSTDFTGAAEAPWVAGLAGAVRRGVDLDRLTVMAAEVQVQEPSRKAGREREEGDAVRIGVARDEAFCFYYQDNLDLLEALGAELVPFSPLHDPGLPEGIDGLYLGGGYPEVHAKRLRANRTLLAEVREKSEAGFPIYAECGGMIFLAQGLHDPGGDFHPMARVFPFAVEMLSRRQALGYVTVTLAEDNLLGASGDVIRGHEFHYSRIANQGDAHLWCTTAVRKRAGEESRPEGYRVNNTLGSYVHLHFGAFPEAAAHLVGKMREQRGQELKIKEE